MYFLCHINVMPMKLVILCMEYFINVHETHLAYITVAFFLRFTIRNGQFLKINVISVIFLL